MGNLQGAEIVCRARNTAGVIFGKFNLLQGVNQWSGHQSTVLVASELSDTWSFLLSSEGYKLKENKAMKPNRGKEVVKIIRYPLVLVASSNHWWQSLKQAWPLLSVRKPRDAGTFTPSQEGWQWPPKLVTGRTRLTIASATIIINKGTSPFCWKKGFTLRNQENDSRTQIQGIS